MDKPLVDLLHIPENCHHLLKARVSDFIHGSSWSIPSPINQKFPELANILLKVHIPFFSETDHMIWTGSELGKLPFKEAFFHLNPPRSNLNWCKLIWNSSIPPSKSCIVWRLMHNKMSTYENLRKMGSIIVSTCSNCGLSKESSSHLFLDWPFAQSLWNWFGFVIDSHVDLSLLNLYYLFVIEIAVGNWRMLFFLVWFTLSGSFGLEGTNSGLIINASL